MRELSVAIVGAGLGGLCLAQALRRAGISAQVFERDRGRWDRPQGYRLHLDADGVNAVREVLAPEGVRRFAATSMTPLPFHSIIARDLSPVARRPADDHGEEPIHANVDRATLRALMLDGIDVQFGEKFERYESDASGVTVHFASRRTVRADVLVGADGIRSAVRAQRVPGARVQDSGVRAIYGRLPIAVARAGLPAAALDDVFTVALDDDKRFLGLGPVIFPEQPAPKEDYEVCIIGARRELYGAEDAVLRRMPSADLQQHAQQVLASWPEHVRAVIAAGDPTSFFYVEMMTSVPIEMPPSPNVTLIGDAIHAMTPTLGRGANLAMRDGARLDRVLATGGPLGAFEAEMTAYGFAVVRESAALGARLMGQVPLP